MFNKIIYFLAFLIIYSCTLLAQLKIENVKVTQSETHFLIEYDMIAEENEEYEIKLFLMRESEPKFKYPVLTAKGDIGKLIYSKGKKLISYPVDNSYIEFNPEITDFIFQIEAYEQKKGIAWYYYALGGILTGGVAAILLLNKGSDDSEAPVTVGAPPIRP